MALKPFCPHFLLLTNKDLRAVVQAPDELFVELVGCDEVRVELWVWIVHSASWCGFFPLGYGPQEKRRIPPSSSSLVCHLTFRSAMLAYR